MSVAKNDSATALSWQFPVRLQESRTSLALAHSASVLLVYWAPLSVLSRFLLSTDRGCHYRWPGWIAICDENHLVRSMSKKGCSPDNSAMEGFFGRLKNEFFHHREWSGVTVPEFCRMLDAYLRYYNEERPKEKLGSMSPMQYRRSLGLAA